MIFVLEYNSNKSSSSNQKQQKVSKTTSTNGNYKYKKNSKSENKNSNRPIEGSVHVYSYKGEYMRNIKTNSDLHMYQADIIGIAFSESERRLGTVNTDHSLSFWDASDSFSFE